jgi:hypothetical protein
MFEKRKAKKAVLAERRAAIQAETQLRAWEQEHQVIEWCLNQAQVVQRGEDPTPDDVCPIPLKADEHALYVLKSASLVEPRRAPGQWAGGSSGVSVRVPGTKSMRYRVGGTRGAYVQGAESPTVIDSGVFVITNVRAVFLGPKQSREWAWSKLVGLHKDEAADTWVGIAVSNREKVSGVAYFPQDAYSVGLYLDLGIAQANGKVDELIRELTEWREAHAKEKPSVPVSASPSLPESRQEPANPSEA